MKHVKHSKAADAANQASLILFGASLFVATIVCAELFGRPMTRAANQERPAVTRVERGERVRGAAPAPARTRPSADDKWDCGTKTMKTQRTGR